MRIQFWHIVVLLLVVLLLFGANRLPDLARSVGKSMKIFKNEVQELRGESPPPDGEAPPNAPDAQGRSTSDADDGGNRPASSGPAPGDPGSKDR